MRDIGESVQTFLRIGGAPLALTSESKATSKNGLFASDDNSGALIWRSNEGYQTYEFDTPGSIIYNTSDTSSNELDKLYLDNCTQQISSHLFEGQSCTTYVVGASATECAKVLLNTQEQDGLINSVAGKFVESAEHYASYLSEEVNGFTMRVRFTCCCIAISRQHEDVANPFTTVDILSKVLCESEGREGHLFASNGDKFPAVFDIPIIFNDINSSESPSEASNHNSPFLINQYTGGIQILRVHEAHCKNDVELARIATHCVSHAMNLTTSTTEQPYIVLQFKANMRHMGFKHDNDLHELKWNLFSIPADIAQQDTIAYPHLKYDFGTNNNDSACTLLDAVVQVSCQCGSPHNDALLNNYEHPILQSLKVLTADEGVNFAIRFSNDMENDSLIGQLLTIAVRMQDATNYPLAYNARTTALLNHLNSILEHRTEKNLIRYIANSRQQNDHSEMSDEFIKQALSNTRIHTLRSLLIKSTHERQELENDLDTLETENDALRDSLSDLQNYVYELQAAGQMNQSTISHATSHMSLGSQDQQNTISLLHRRIASLNQMIALLRKHIDPAIFRSIQQAAMYNEQNRAFSDGLDVINRPDTHKLSRKRTVKKDRVTSTSPPSATTSANSSPVSSEKHVKRENTTRKVKSKPSTSDQSNFQVALSQKDEKIAALQEEISSLLAKLRRQQDEKDELREQTFRLREKVSNLEKEALLNETRTIRASQPDQTPSVPVSDTKTNSTSISAQEYYDMQQKLERVESVKRELQMQNNSLHKDASDLRQQAAALHNQLEAVRQTQAENNASYETPDNNQQETILKLKATIKKLQSEKQTLQSKTESLQRENEKLREIPSKLTITGDEETLLGLLQRAEKRSAELMSKCIVLESQVQHYEEHMKQLNTKHQQQLAKLKKSKGK